MKRTSTPNSAETLASLYTFKLPVEQVGNSFFPEYSILQKTAESVNSFYNSYKKKKTGKLGPTTHIDQDIYRAMLVFACAGLDVFVKHLVTNKLPLLIALDSVAENNFTEYVRDDLKDDKINRLLALALINPTPRSVLLEKYLDHIARGSLQSEEALFKVVKASGMDEKKLLNKTKKAALEDAFEVRNQIIHEMDISISGSIPRNQGYRTRRQRVARHMENHTKAILDFAGELYSAYKAKFETYQIGIQKQTKARGKVAKNKKSN